MATEYTIEPTTAYYTTTGSVRGCCGHRHKTVAAAERCLSKDQHGCRSQGGYSDRHTIAVDTDGCRRDLSDGEWNSVYG